MTTTALGGKLSGRNIFYLRRKAGCLKLITEKTLKGMCDDKLHQGADIRLFHYARENREHATKAEKILWQHLRNRKLKGFKFRRQNPIADFVADFYCVECNLVIEIDGGYHASIEQRQYDEGRTYELSELKIKVVRFANEEVCENINYVLEEIKKHLVPAKR